MSIFENTPKGNHIESPVIRYLYDVIANSLLTCADYARVNGDDMIILAKVVIPNYNMMPNLGTILLFHLERQAHQACDCITCGGIPTIVATTLAINVSGLRPLHDERQVFYTTLRVVGMLYKKRGSFFVHIPGAERFLRVPLPNNLFSLQDSRLHYVEHEEKEEPYLDEANEEEMEEIEAGVELPVEVVHILEVTRAAARVELP
jgi:hypothetical protein